MKEPRTKVSGGDRAAYFVRDSLAFFRSRQFQADYAKFELDDPPPVLSLEPTPRPVGGPLNHLGFRMPDSAALVAMQQRLELAGIRSKREEGVECCYARQTKFWVTDPDQTLWEIYTLEEDLDHRGPGQSLDEMLPRCLVIDDTPAAVWEHRMTDPVPANIPLADNSVEEVRLRGTFNLPLEETAQRHLLDEAWRTLRRGGRLFIHVLVADRPVAGPLDLPGPAALVQHVPLEKLPPELMNAAGFQRIRLIKFDDKPCFVRAGACLCEMQVEGFKA